MWVAAGTALQGRAGKTGVADEGGLSSLGSPRNQGIWRPSKSRSLDDGHPPSIQVPPSVHP